MHPGLLNFVELQLPVTITSTHTVRVKKLPIPFTVSPFSVPFSASFRFTVLPFRSPFYRSVSPFYRCKYRLSRER